MSDMPALLHRVKILHQLKHTASALLSAVCSQNTYSMAYGNAWEGTERRRNNLRDKLEKACSEVAYLEHEAHCLAVDAGLALAEPERYGVPRRAFTADGSGLAPTLTRWPECLLPAANVVENHHVNR